MEHFVKPEIVPGPPGRCFQIASIASCRMETANFSGRVAVERFTCVNCLNENALRDKVWAEMKRDARRLEQQQKTSSSNYWLNICELVMPGLQRSIIQNILSSMAEPRHR